MPITSKIVVLILTITLFCSTSCVRQKNKKIIVDNTYAVGEQIDDSIMNGLVNFYDTATGNLVSTATYINGQINGTRKDYFLNGRIQYISNFSNDKQHGEVISFDSTGNKIQSQYFYYDLPCGSSINYKEGKPTSYQFNSIEYKELFSIDYNAGKNNRISQINNSDFFFWNLKNYFTSISDSAKFELFVYLPNPPKLNFEYSLCIITDTYAVIKVLEDYSTNSPWETTSLNFSTLQKGQSFALRLSVENEFDSTDTRKAVLFKKIIE